MPGTALVQDNEANAIDQAAVERGRAAYWAWELVTWIAEFGPGGHADSIYSYYREARAWAEHYTRYPVTF